MSLESFRNSIEAWAAASAQGDKEGQFARDCGLPVLAALLDLRDRLEAARGRISPTEILAELSTLIQLAIGEGQLRAQARFGERCELPGIPSIPAGDVL